MKEYKILVQKVFESNAKFEARLNDFCQRGWKAISMVYKGTVMAVLLEKTGKEYTY